MSTTDVSIKSKQVDVQTASQISGCDTRIGNVLGGGKASDSTIINPQPEDKKIARQNDIRNLAKNYKVSVNDIHNFIQKAFGYSVEEFYALSEDKYNTISDRTLPTIFDLLQRKQSNRSIQERLDKFGEKFAEMIQNGNTIEEATNFFEHFEDNGLFQILKIQFPSELKQYKNAKDVPQNILENCIQRFFVKFKQHENSNNNKNIGKTLTIFKNLLSRTSDEDYKVLLNAFIKVVSKEDEKFAGIVAAIEKFKDPVEFKKFLNNDLAEFCVKYGLDLNKTQQMVRSLAKTAKETGIDSKEFMDKLIDLFNPENIYNKLVEKQKKGEELSKDQIEYINNYNEYERIQEKKKNGETLTEEETKFLGAFEEKGKQIEADIVAAIIGENPDQAKDLIELAQQKYGIKKEDIIKQIIDFSKKFDDYKVDTKILDEATDGAFSQALAQSNNIENSSAENSFGLSQRVSAEAFSQSAENLPILRAQVVEEKDEPINVEKKAQKDSPTESQLLKDVKAFNIALAAHKIKIEVAGKNFGNAVQSIQDKVLTYLERQNNNDRLSLINSWHNSELTSVSANKFDFNTEQIEELNTSIGRKQVMKNNYEQKHKNDKKEAV